MDQSRRVAIPTISCTCRQRLLSGTALALCFGLVQPQSAQAACTTAANVTTCTGDVSAGVPDQFNPVDTLIIENTTTPMGGRSIFMSNSTGDVTVTADFGAQGLMNDPTGFGTTSQTGIGINAFSGGASVSLTGNLMIQNGPDITGTVNAITNRGAGLDIRADGPVSLTQNGNLTVTGGSQTVNSSFVGAVDNGLFGGIFAIDDRETEGQTDTLTVDRTGNLSVTGPAFTATSTDTSGPNRVIVGNVAGSPSSAIYGLLTIAPGNISIQNSGDISVTNGDLNATAASTGDRAEAVADGHFTVGIGAPRFIDNDFFFSTEQPRSDTVTVNHTGNILVDAGTRTLSATSFTQTGGPASEAVVRMGSDFLGDDVVRGVNITTALNLDATFVGDIMADGGQTNVTADALAGPDMTNGLVSAEGFGASAQGANITSFSLFTENDTDNDGMADVTFDGAITAVGGDVTGTVAGSGLAQSIDSGFPPPSDQPLGRIVFGGGSATGITLTGFRDETTISANADTQSRFIEIVDQMTLTLTGPVSATGGTADVTIRGADLPGRVSGGSALGLGTGFDAITLNVTPDVTFTATGGDANVTLEGSQGLFDVRGGIATGVNTALQSNDDVSFDADVTATGGNAILTGDAGTDDSYGSLALGGQASGLRIGHEDELFNSERDALSDAELAILNERQLFITGDVVATGGNATGSDPDVLAVGGRAVGIEINFAPNTVVQGDVTATGGMGTDRNGSVAGVTFDSFGSFFPGFLPLDTPSQTIRIEGNVMASGQGFAVDDLNSVLPRSEYFGTDFSTNSTLSAGVSAITFGLSEVTIANGGSVTTQGEYVHGLLAASEANSIIIENGGTVTAQGMGANGIEVRPYHDTGFSQVGIGQGSDVHVVIANGGQVISQQGTGIKDEEQVQATDLFDPELPRVVETYVNTVQVDLAGTVTGGNGTAMDLGRGSDVVNLFATSTTNGSINTGAGDDALTLFAGAEVNGTIKLGVGTDVLGFDGGAMTTETFSFTGDTGVVIDGFERFEKRGAGTWIFEGDMVPATTPLSEGRIFNGTAVVNANLSMVDLINDVNGRLEGTGALGNLDNRGVFAPGGVGTIADFDVTGNLVLADTGTLHVDILAPDQSDRITVGGQTTLDGALSVNGLGMASDFADEDAFTIIDSAGGVTGAFATVTDNLPDLDLIVGIEDNGAAADTLVVVGFEADTTPPPPPPPPTPPNPPEPPEPPAPPVPNTSDKAVHPNALQAAAHAGQQLTDLMQDRGTGQRGGAQGDTGGAVTRLSSRGAGLGARHYSWGTVFGASRDVDGTLAITGYDATTAGIALGYEMVMDEEAGKTILGFAASYGQTDMSSGPSSAEIESYSFGIYGSHEWSNWRLSGALSYGMQDYDITRIIPIGAGFATAAATPEGTSLAASARLAYDIAPDLGLNTRDAMRLAPYMQFDFVEVSRDGYAETGAGVLNLTVGSDSFSQSSVRLGVESSAEIRNPGGSVTRPYFDIHWEHVLAGRNGITNSFVTGTPTATFASSGAFESRDRLGVGAGVRFEVNDKAALNMRYNGAFADGYTDHAASIAFTLSF